MKILHISDLHIVPGVGEKIYGVDSFVSLERVLAHGLALSPDCIIATGDLTEHGDSTSYQRLQKLFLSTDLPVFVTPGNHDSPERITSELICERIQYRNSYDTNGWRFIFLNSRQEGKSYGKIAIEEKERLQKALLKAPKQYLLVALHHTPITPCPSLGCQLRGASDFLENLSSYSNVRAVIAGHAHIESAARFHNIQVMTTPSTCAEAIHTPASDCQDLLNFWLSHRFEPSRQGYRLLILDSYGTVSSKVHWVDNPLF